MMFSIRRSLCLAAVAALPLTAGAGIAGAEGLSAGQDRLRVDTNTDLTDGDNFVVDARVATVDDDGDATGLRSQTTSSDVEDLEDFRSDNRTVTDDGNDATSSRAILGLDDATSLDDLDTDIDVVTSDQGDHDDSSDAMTAGDAVGDEPNGNNQNDEQQFADDAEFVFGR